MILFSLKFYGLGDQVLQLLPSCSVLITMSFCTKTERTRKTPLWPENLHTFKSLLLTLQLSHLTFGPHEWSADVADLLIPQFDLSVTINFDVWGVLYENNILDFSADGTSFTDLEAWWTAYFDYEAWEAEVGGVGDIKSSAVGVLAFVLQPHIYHHPPPVSLYDPPQTLSPSFT